MRHTRIIETGYTCIDEALDLMRVSVRKCDVEKHAASAYSIALYMRRLRAISKNEYAMLVSNIDDAVTESNKLVADFDESTQSWMLDDVDDYI